MKVVIPMAGFGKRLRPWTHSRPKPLINVAGKPVLAHVLDSLKGLEISELLCVTGYLGDQIEAFVQENYDIPSRFFVQEELNGQSPAIHLCKDFLDGPCLITFVDTIIRADLSSLEDTRADSIAFVQEIEDPSRFGVAQLDNEGFVTRLVEKPEGSSSGNLVVVGFYYIKDGKKLISAIEYQLEHDIQTKGEYYLTDAFNIMLEQGSNMRTQTVDAWLDCGKSETVLETNRYLLDHGADNSDSVSFEDAILIPPVQVHPSALISRSVIGPHVAVGEGCRIESSIISNSVVEPKAAIKAALITDSIIGIDSSVEGRINTYHLGDTNSVFDAPDS
ncbi:MAG: sugar phosphate nucleotidyltransferase [Chloroflexota bacterium]